MQTAPLAALIPLLVMAYGPRVRINPPLVVTEQEAAAGLDILESVFADLALEL